MDEHRANVLLRDGPELTGANRFNLEYLLGNILTPSAVIQDAYRMLIVTTTDIDFDYFNVLAAPKAISQSRNVHVVETFRLREGGAFLDYTMTVTDPETFTRPLTFNKYWQFRPGAMVERS